MQGEWNGAETNPTQDLEFHFRQDTIEVLYVMFGVSLCPTWRAKDLGKVFDYLYKFIIIINRLYSKETKKGAQLKGVCIPAPRMHIIFTMHERYRQLMGKF